MDENPARTRIITWAQQQVDLGAHYLKGAHGAAPGEACLGVHVRSNEDISIAHLAVHACHTSHQICYGRWKEVGGKLLGTGGQTIEQAKAAIAKYCADNAGTLPDQMPAWEGTTLYPRRLKSTAVAIGDDCRGKRHFDCIGFVYWVLNQVNGGPAWMSHHIKSYGKGNEFVDAMGQLDRDQIRDGDLAWRNTVHEDGSVGSHIAFVSQAGFAIQAEWESSGVVSRGYKPLDWNGISRIKEEFLPF